MYYPCSFVVAAESLASYDWLYLVPKWTCHENVSSVQNISQPFTKNEGMDANVCTNAHIDTFTQIIFVHTHTFVISIQLNYLDDHYLILGAFFMLVPVLLLLIIWNGISPFFFEKIFVENGVRKTIQ